MNRNEGLPRVDAIGADKTELTGSAEGPDMGGRKEEGDEQSGGWTGVSFTEMEKVGGGPVAEGGVDRGMEIKSPV